MKELIAISISILLIGFALVKMSVDNLNIEEENRRLVYENLSLKIENVNLNKIINKEDAELSDTTIVLDVTKFKVVSVSFSSGKTTHTTYRFVYVGSGKK